MNDTNKPVLICLTPMKNEAWVLERFLQCASVWADHIIIADQRSDDGSREIALRYPKVILVDNPGTGYDEGERQRLVFEAARRIPGRRIMLAIDADEVVSANWRDSPEWQALREASPGTVISFRWANLMPDMTTCWLPPGDIPMGFVDDGVSGHSAGALHVPRLPRPAGAPWLRMQDVYVLHYQYTDWERMKSKQRHYQCLEVLDHPKRRAIDIFRQYHRMDVVTPDQKQPVQTEWTIGYEERGIVMNIVNKEGAYRWDKEVVNLLIQHGPEKFRKCDIWDAEWNTLARGFGLTPAQTLADPRTPFEKRIHRWLHRTQGRSLDRTVRVRQRLLRLLGW